MRHVSSRGLYEGLLCGLADPGDGGAAWVAVVGGSRSVRGARRRPRSGSAAVGRGPRSRCRNALTPGCAGRSLNAGAHGWSSRRNLSPNARASASEPNRSGKPGAYFSVLNPYGSVRGTRAPEDARSTSWVTRMLGSSSTRSRWLGPTSIDRSSPAPPATVRFSTCTWSVCTNRIVGLPTVAPTRAKVCTSYPALLRGLSSSPTSIPTGRIQPSRLFLEVPPGPWRHPQ